MVSKSKTMLQTRKGPHYGFKNGKISISNKGLLGWIFLTWIRREINRWQRQVAKMLTLLFNPLTGLIGIVTRKLIYMISNIFKKALLGTFGPQGLANLLYHEQAYVLKRYNHCNYIHHSTQVHIQHTLSKIIATKILAYQTWCLVMVAWNITLTQNK